jgi:hypothetical protein
MVVATLGSEVRLHCLDPCLLVCPDDPNGFDSSVPNSSCIFGASGTISRPSRCLGDFVHSFQFGWLISCLLSSLAIRSTTVWASSARLTLSRERRGRWETLSECLCFKNCLNSLGCFCHGHMVARMAWVNRCAIRRTTNDGSLAKASAMTMS